MIIIWFDLHAIVGSCAQPYCTSLLGGKGIFQLHLSSTKHHYLIQSLHRKSTALIVLPPGQGTVDGFFASANKAPDTPKGAKKTLNSEVNIAALAQTKDLTNAKEQAGKATVTEEQANKGG